MRVLPILFNTPMTQSVLAGNKTQTRRVITPQPREKTIPVYENGVLSWAYMAAGICYVDKAKPRYQPGDVLYVRETWGRTFYADASMPEFVYRASDPEWGEHDGWKWRPSVHMPKEAARIFLRVTDVRVERLQDIDENGAIAEGFYKGWRLCGRGSLALSARQAFMWFWETMTRKAPAAQSWACNPWVWVYSFARITREEAEAAMKGDADG